MASKVINFSKKELLILKKTFRTFVYSLIFFSTFVHVAPVFAPPPVCEEIQVDRRRVWCKKDYDVTQLKENFADLKKRGYAPTKAVGVLGELYARDAIEEKTPYTSIVTHFKNMGCTVENDIRDGGGRGVDDIFVRLTADGKINRNFKPIFHEAKFSKNCELKLSKTKTICQQLSTQWLTHHVRGAQQRAIDGASLCFDDINKLTITPCSACKSTFVNDMTWIFQMLTAERFHRTASVLCPDGQLRVYNVNSRE